MSTKTKKIPLVLAIDPIPRGFAFAVMEGPQTLLDWGVCDLRLRKNARSLERISSLREFYGPDAVVVENTTDASSRRCHRIRNLIDDIHDHADDHGVSVFSYSPQEVKTLFQQYGARTKYEIADAIVEWLPELMSKKPPLRKAWMSEDPRINIFDAVALALTFFYRKTD